MNQRQDRACRTVRILLGALAALAVLGLAGCGGDDITVVDGGGGGGGFTVTVDTSTGVDTPTYLWTGGNASGLAVKDGAAVFVWDVLSNTSSDTLPSGYKHGGTPVAGNSLNLLSGPGALSPLPAGTYTVQVTRAGGSTASAVFTVP